MQNVGFEKPQGRVRPGPLSMVQRPPKRLGSVMFFDALWRVARKRFLRKEKGLHRSSQSVACRSHEHESV